MINIVILGGSLQGFEAAYLAKKAGWNSTVIDRRENAIAKYMADSFIVADLCHYDDRFLKLLVEADVVLPAFENHESIKAIEKLSNKYAINLVFDFESYRISSSKKKSDQIFRENGIPAPRYYPWGNGPYIIKPSASSGSDNIIYASSKEDVEKILKDNSSGDDLLVQEFISGPSYSLEIIGREGSYKVYQITEIVVDENYDCKRVYAPCHLPEDIKEEFENISLSLGKLLDLEGIMDVEVINHNGKLKVLEIDARVPSQTPTVVYHSRGINLLVELIEKFLDCDFEKNIFDKEKYVSYEHMMIDGNEIKILGEHMMAISHDLVHRYGFCGADESISNYSKNKKRWFGTFINIGENKIELEEKRKNMFKEIEEIQGEGKCELIDLGPDY